MTNASKPLVFVGATHHDADIRGPITGVRFSASYGSMQAGISFVDMPPVPNDATQGAEFLRLLGDLGRALVEVSQNPRQLMGYGQASVNPSEPRFPGPGPFSIGAAQSTSARALSSAVEMTLNAIVGGAETPRAIHCQMTALVAAGLADQLHDAVGQVGARRES
jgi:hypothetical protein